MRKLLLICSIVLLCTNAFGVKRSTKDYNYDRSQAYFQKSNKKENSKKFSNTSNSNKREVKKRKMLDKEREGTESLFDNYNYWEALNFFKEVSESEHYPTLTWVDDEVDRNRLWKVDFGEFEQRKKFIDMFENYDGKGVSICIRVNFSYGGLRHDMFIEQPERSREYSTDKFLFQNSLNFDEKRSSFTLGYVKPYLSKKNKDGILAKFINHPEHIQKFATNVLRIIKLSPKGILPVDLWEMDINRVLTFESFEIAGMILSTERLRSKKALLLSYIEFYKLKHTTNHKDSLVMLLDMFDKDGPTLRFPASPGGIEAIRKTHYYYVYKRFLDMLKYSPEYPIIQQCKNKNTQRKLMDEFFRGKLEKIRAVFENRQPKFKSGFKAAVQSYQSRLNAFQTKEIKINTTKFNSSSSNIKSNALFPNELNSENTNNPSQKAENNPDEYFDEFDNLSDSDYNAILNDAISSEIGSNQKNAVINTNNTAQKVENNPDEYFDELDNFSDSDYNTVLNNAISRNTKAAR